MSFKPSKSKARLLAGQINTIEIDGFVGCQFWLVKADQAVAPPLPPRWKATPTLQTGKTVVRTGRKGIATSAPVVILPPAAQATGPLAHPLGMEYSHTARWPYAVNPDFLAHVERCTPDDCSWRLTADGRLLRVRRLPNRQRSLLGMVALIRDPRWMEDSR